MVEIRLLKYKMAVTTTVKFQLRRDTSSNWASNNPILSSGEPGVETDTGVFKIGNGSTAWNSLSPISGGSGTTGPTGPASSVTGPTGPDLIVTGKQIGRASCRERVCLYV